jgi:hypothetical protein
MDGLTVRNYHVDPPDATNWTGSGHSRAGNLGRLGTVSGGQACYAATHLPMHTRSSLTAVAIVIGLFGGGSGPAAQAPQRSGQSDLDTFMAQVLARRDENWRKLQQYVLDEREHAEVLGPAGSRLYGLEREYTWYIRDGVFVRSPVRFDGVTLTETERRDYERRWLERERQREERRAARDKGNPDQTPGAGATGEEARAGDMDSIIKLTREPQFVSAAYFLRFKFEPGRYALVGRETFESRNVLRIEYYPQRLYADDDHDKDKDKDKDKKEQPRDQKSEQEKAKEKEVEDRLERQMNKVALVTLWVEPTEHQIVKYTFDNVGFDFLPGRSIVRLDTLRASMQMAEAFPDVWLPGGIDGHAAFTLANGTYDVRYELAYANYRQADVKAKLR